MSSNRSAFVLFAILASLALHLFMMGGVVYFAPLMEHKSPRTIEVALFPEGQIRDALIPRKEKKQIVRQALVPEKLKAPDDDTLAKYLSEQKQRVKEETQAARAGMTENRSNQGFSAPQKHAQQQQQKQSVKSEEKDKNGYKDVDITKELQEMNRFNEGMSTIGESMPQDMKVGSFTALNTDRYLFYTFYARMEELIRYRWESRVQRAIENFDRTTLVNIGNRNWVTQVEFLLDKEGVLQKALIMKESGINTFDAAAVNAFRDARIFPNPPKEMIEEDGYIHIKFAFTVNFSPPNLVNSN